MTLEELINHGNKIKKLIKKEKFNEASDLLNILNGTGGHIIDRENYISHKHSITIPTKKIIK